MSNNSISTRRRFLKGGALLTVPIAAAPVCAVAPVDSRAAPDALAARLVRLEDEAAIRKLHQSWLRRVNAGEAGGAQDESIRRISADCAGVPETLEIAANGQSAIGTFSCAVELETPLDRDSTLAQMAHAQGHGLIRHTERRKLTVDYIKAGGSWEIGQVTLT